MTRPLQPLRFSLVVPIYNEEENVESMLAEVAEVLLPHGPFEALFVDDGSVDRSRARMQAWKQQHGADWLRIVCLERNAGQSAAVHAGASAAQAPLIATLDGDMQNDPRDLPAMLQRVEQGAMPWSACASAARTASPAGCRRGSATACAT
jgi:glycosyltransferase involved in cell wall biosynthesis